MKTLKILCLATIVWNWIGGSGMAQTLDLTENTESFLLKSGVPVILRSAKDELGPSAEVVALRITAYGGVTLSEKPGALGLLAELMMKGTYSYSKEAIDELLTRTGSSLNVEAGNDSIDVSLRTLRRSLPEILPLVSELIQRPLLEEKELNLLKAQQIADLKTEQDRPDGLLGLKMTEVFYGDHPYSRRPEGYLGTIEGISRTDLHSLLFKTFNKQNILVTLVAEYSREESMALLEPFFTALPEGKRYPPATEAPKNDFSEVHFVASPSASTTYFLARFKSPSLEHPDYPALMIGMRILNNRLFDEIRTKRGLGYSTSARLAGGRVGHGGFFVFSTDPIQAVEVMFQEVNRMKEALVLEKDIELQIHKYLSGWYMGRETRSGQASILSHYELMGIGWENANSFVHRLRRVDQAAVQAAMRKYLQEISFVAVGKEKPELAPVLQAAGYLPNVAASEEK